MLSLRASLPSEARIVHSSVVKEKKKNVDISRELHILLVQSITKSALAAEIFFSSEENSQINKQHSIRAHLLV